MQKRKIVAALAALLITAGCLTGCGSKSESMTSADSANNSSHSANYNESFNPFDPFDAIQGVFIPDSADNAMAAEEWIPEPSMPMPENTEEYDYIEENGYVAVSNAPLSTFSSDVDTASYTNLRRMILNGEDIPVDAVRLEEMINYFDYGYDDPIEDEPFSVYTELSDCPWNNDTQLFMVGLSTKGFDTLLEARPPMNLVFLIDVSGSMYDEDKLPLVQQSFDLLTKNLTVNDRISIVTYAGEDAVLLEGANGNEKEKIMDIVDSLEAGGSTAGAAGITTAYEIAQNNFIEGGNNRIILATDGDLNVGISSESELQRLIESKRDNGIYLSVLGFGRGNYKDNKMEAIADNGNGNYSYIDSVREARRVLVDEMSGTLFTAAKDVKFQVEFNPENVKGYRLIGYENRLMDAADFDDDTKDAGDIGAGHSVTALYEIVPIDSPMEIAGSDLKYSQTNPVEDLAGELLTVSIRYKEPDGDESKLLSYPVDKALYDANMSERMNFASCVSEFGMLLRDSKYIGNITYDDIRAQLKKYDYSTDEYKDEFEYLVSTANRNN